MSDETLDPDSDEMRGTDLYSQLDFQNRFNDEQTQPTSSELEVISRLGKYMLCSQGLGQRSLAERKHWEKYPQLLSQSSTFDYWQLVWQYSDAANKDRDDPDELSESLEDANSRNWHVPVPYKIPTEITAENVLRVARLMSFVRDRKIIAKVREDCVAKRDEIKSRSDASDEETKKDMTQTAKYWQDCIDYVDEYTGHLDYWDGQTTVS